MPLIPEWFEESLTRLRGRSIYGDPVIRVVWGPDERDHRGNYKYVHPDGGPMNCFVLERWQPAGFFGSRENWEKTSRVFDDVHGQWVNLKGPFPERGRYVMICPIWTNEGKYMPLDESVLTAIRRKINGDEDFAGLTPTDRHELVKQANEREEKARQYDADKRQEDIREYHLHNWDKMVRSQTRGYSITPR